MQVQPTTITQKGQVTIPAQVRKVLGLKRGDQVRFIVTKKKEVKVKTAKRFSIMSLYGSLKPKIKPKLTGQKLIKWEEQAWPKAAVERDRKILRLLGALSRTNR